MTKKEARNLLRARLRLKDQGLGYLGESIGVSASTLATRWQKWNWTIQELLAMKKMFNLSDRELITIMEATDQKTEEEEEDGCIFQLM